MAVAPPDRIERGHHFTLKRLGVCLLIAVVAAILFDGLTTFRREFRELDVDDAVTGPTNDPIQVALQVAAYPNLDNTQSDRVRQDCGNGRCVVTVTDNYRHDDSVSAEQTRVELAWTPEGWTIEWAGHRWMCQPGRGNPLVFGWGTTPCT